MLIVENVSKKYNLKKSNEDLALKKINLSFEYKGLVFILGPSGCGKTTLLNLIGGIDTPTNGYIKINNKSIGTTEEELDLYRNNHIGFIFQDFNLLDNMTIYDNLSIVFFKNSNYERKTKILNCLEKVGLKGYENRFPNELSGGQMQRVAIARALLKESEILLADEPTGNLNEEMSKEIFELLKDVSKEKLVIVVTHNKEMAYLYANRIIELRDGSIISDTNLKSEHEKLIISKKNKKFVDNNNIFKLALLNFNASKFDIIFNFIILFLCFMCIASTFSIVNYKRVDTDIKNLKSMGEIENFSLERYSYDDGVDINISHAQVDQIKKNNNNLHYIEDGVIKDSESLLKFGFELYDNYNEISCEGIYIFEYKIKEAIQNGRLFYDNVGSKIVEKTEVTGYFNLVNTYLCFEKYGIKTFVKIDGIVKDLVDPKKHSVFENKEEQAKHYYYQAFQERINVFYLDDSLYEREIFKDEDLHLHSSFIDGPIKIFINNNELENSDIIFSDVMYGNFASQIGDIILTNNELITDFKSNSVDDLFKVEQENEVYISLSLYNLIFDEYSSFDYYIDKVGFRKYQIKNYPTHIGESISLDILDYYFSDYNLNFDNLTIKGIILDEYGSNYSGGILISSNKYCDIYELASTPNIYINKNSIGNIESFVKYCAELTVCPNYICSEAIDTFEENIKMVKLVFSILSGMLFIISFLVIYSLANRLIRKRTKEFGILKAIGLCNKDIVKIFNMLIYIISIMLLVSILPLSYLSIYLINNIVVSEMYSGLTIIFYKWWYTLIIVFFISNTIILATLAVLSKFSKMKAIKLIRNNNAY